MRAKNQVRALIANQRRPLSLATGSLTVAGGGVLYRPQRGDAKHHPSYLSPLAPAKKPKGSLDPKNFKEFKLSS